MTALVGRALGWVCSWGRITGSDKTKGFEDDEPRKCHSKQSSKGWTSWIWGGWKYQKDQSSPVEEFWEAQEKIQPVQIADVRAGKQETGHVVRWWNKYLPTSYSLWPRKTESNTLRQEKCHGRKTSARDDDDVDGDFRTPPPSPTFFSLTRSPFRLFAHGWKVEILSEHYEICFNFLRHLFDLFVVGFLWTVSPPTKLILEVLGVQGALRLWIHGMAMFLVSTVGMAGLLGLIQEYLPQFALIYGIIQAAVISVSVRQSVMLDVEDKKEKGDEEKGTNEMTDESLQNQNLVSPVDKMKRS